MFIIHIITLFIFIFDAGLCVPQKLCGNAAGRDKQSGTFIVRTQFWQTLGWIDGIAPLLLCGVVLYFFTRKGEQRKELLRQCIEILKDPSTIAGIILLLLVVIGVSGKVVSWWDDYNFWATDVKSDLLPEWICR